MCDSDCDCETWEDSWSDSDDDYYSQRKSRRKKKQSCIAFLSFQPSDEPDGPPKLVVKRKPKRVSQRVFKDSFPRPVPCVAMKKITRKPYVTPRGVTPQGQQSITPQEEVLNWHTDNAVKELKERLTHQALQLDHDLKSCIQTHYFGPDFQRKNQELIKIKAQLKQIEDDRSRQTRPQALTIDPLSMYPPPYPTYSPILFPPSPQNSPPDRSPDYESIFKSNYQLARKFQPKNTPPPVQPTGFQPKAPQGPRPRPPWKSGEFFREEFPGQTSGIKETKEK
ncbi:hypothetical protein PIB30_049744 [Stylosanthes scabra]|uniref:Uncharacterized protein n=1 Tax=Stylosanthes scabra TaxID=79078 RepID=A0ABU6VGW1_9FABA|nr:hypothetical protein [Stylosanthes scabra]